MENAQHFAGIGPDNKPWIYDVFMSFLSIRVENENMT